MKRYLIIVAGGTGSRMKSEVPKQFMPLAGIPVIAHVVTRFTQVLKDLKIVVALAPGLEEEFEAIRKKHFPDAAIEVVQGGETRYHSVANALKNVPDAVVVGIHDAARPLVSLDTILRVYEEADIYGNATPAVPLNESIRVVKGKENVGADRSIYRIVQTPQCFRSDLLKQAFAKGYKEAFTDDATVLEAFGEKINLVEGNRENIKITHASDLVVAEALLRAVSDTPAH